MDRQEFDEQISTKNSNIKHTHPQNIDFNITEVEDDMNSSNFQQSQKSSPKPDKKHAINLDNNNSVKNEKLTQIIIKFLKCFGVGAGLKFAVNFVSNKMNIAKTLKTSNAILRFGLMCGLFSFFFKFTRYLIRKLKINISQDQEVLAAAMMSSLALFMADHRDQNLVKVFLLPRAIEAVYNLLVEKGIIQPIRFGTQIMAIAIMYVISYNFLWEPHNMTPSFMKTLYNYSNRTKGEAFLLDAMRENVVLNGKDFYKSHNFGALTYKY
eukprot:403348975